MGEKEERIKQRREIIRRRHYGDKKETDNPASSHGKKDDDFGQVKSEQQVVESVSHLQRRKKDQVDTITSFRVNADTAEGALRIEHETFRQTYLSIIKKENEQIQYPRSSWESVSDENDLIRCHDIIEGIKHDYEETITRKDELIESFRKSLIKQDDLYIECLRQHEAVANKVRKKSTTELETMVALYKDELKSIDEAFREDRSSMLSNGTNTLSSLSQKMSTSAKDHLNDMYRRKEDKEENILQTHDAMAEDFNGLRDRLQKQVTDLERQLSVSKGMYSGRWRQRERERESILTTPRTFILFY